MIWPWPPPRRGEIVAFLVLVFTVAVCALAALWPDDTNWGFGTDWRCSFPGRGDPVCVKTPPKPAG